MKRSVTEPFFGVLVNLPELRQSFFGVLVNFPILTSLSEKAVLFLWSPNYASHSAKRPPCSLVVVDRVKMVDFFKTVPL